MRLRTTFLALLRMLPGVKIFYPHRIFKNKRIAIVAAADSAFEEENGNLIDSFDIVIRINKALLKWQPDQQKYIGKKTDILFHSFYENMDLGGGPVSSDILDRFGVKYIVHPHTNLKGLRAHLNFYKRRRRNFKTYLLNRQSFREIKESTERWLPTVGFCALQSVLNSDCEEIFITGFSFFTTPYAHGYRDNITNSLTDHINDQGLHNPEIELKSFIRLVNENKKKKKIVLDPFLNGLIKTAEKEG